MKINKNLLVCGIIFIVSSIIALLIFVVVNLCKMNRDEIYVDNNLDVYTENQLSKYDGGFLAEKFFPEYIELGEYKNLYFQYCDNTSRSNYFHTYYTYFCLDIVLEDVDYNNYVKKLEASTEETVKASHFTVLTEECEYDNLKAILCNDGTQTIRYVLFYGDFEAYDSGISPIIGWNMDLNPKDSSLKTQG